MSELVSDVSDGSFEQDVLKSDKPVLVDFWAPWCGPCRALAPTVDALAQKYDSQAKFVKLNIDDNPQVPLKYGIKAVPTLIMFKGGEEAERVVGPGKDTLNRLVEKYAGSVGGSNSDVLAS